jgi:hypothetical protein
MVLRSDGTSTPPAGPQPAIVRAVHYVARGSADGRFPKACRAATITEVGEDGLVGLMVMNPTGLFFHSLADGGCAHDAEEKAGGTWHWPERI